ncbi:glycosyltransferase family 4 protein [uncultured Methanobrevibacter sp.]|uniref:glycosyltransferase family 4 protein n=1 Tax=uncultured Methanobrevibacter sp. TaxID=253161 RepID=UPI0025E8DFFA|nr:glycosyltransferase family 4 protein [uncultured Methanobrevibacter sp.]
MRIAIITSGILPIPAVQGGAVENLTDYYLEYNEQHCLHDITVYSVWHPDVMRHRALQSKVNHYKYIKTHSFWFRLCAKMYGIIHRNCYYFYQLEYFFEIVIKKILSQQYNLIIIENRPGVAIKLSRKCSTPIINHIHTNIVNGETTQKEAIIIATKKFLAVSNYIKGEIENIGMQANVQVVYNGLDTKRFNREDISPVSRQKLGLSDEDFVTIYTGRIVPKKGVKELLQAFQQLMKYNDVKLLVVGGDNFGDSVQSNVFLDELHEMADKMEGKVKFTGFVPYDQLPAYLKIADVAIVPSKINEALGMACIEACAMGLPVIATDDGGIAETLVGQKHILLKKDDNLPFHIAQAILKIKDNKPDFHGNKLNPIFSKEIYAETFFKAIAL